MPYTILVVDDEPCIGLMVQSRLERHGYSVIYVENGTAALTAAEKLPDLILVDVMMPSPDGLHICRILKSTPQLAHIPVVLFTAKANHEELDEMMKCGAQGYLIKPYTSEELLSTVMKFIPQSGAPSK